VRPARLPATAGHVARPRFFPPEGGMSGLRSARCCGRWSEPGVDLVLPPASGCCGGGAQLYLLALLLSYVVPRRWAQTRSASECCSRRHLVGCVEVSDIQRAFARFSRSWQHARRHDPARASRIGRAGAVWLMALLSSALVLWQIAGPLEQSIGAVTRTGQPILLLRPGDPLSRRPRRRRSDAYRGPIHEIPLGRDDPRGRSTWPAAGSASSTPDTTTCSTVGD